MAVGFIYRFCRLAEVMEVAQLMWHMGEHLRNSTADGQLAVRHDACNRHLHVLTHCPEQDGEVGLGRGQQAARQEDCPGEAVAEDPQHLMADVRLEAIEGQDDPALGVGDPLQTSGIGKREGEQCVVALKQMHDRPRGNGHPTVAQVLMDFGQATVLRVAQSTDTRNDIEAKLVLGQGEPSLFFRSVGAAELWTGPVETAPDLEGEMHHVVQSRDRTIVMIGGPHRLTADGAMTSKWLEGVSCCGGRTRRRTCHGESFSLGCFPIISATLDRSLAQFATLVFLAISKRPVIHSQTFYHSSLQSKSSQAVSALL